LRVDTPKAWQSPAPACIASIGFLYHIISLSD